MQAFAALLDQLLLSPSRNAKLALLQRYFAAAPDPDRGYALAAIAGALSFKTAKPAMLKALVAARTDAELFALSYDYVGDLAETIALVWPSRPGRNSSPSLGEVVEALTVVERDAAPQLVESWLDALGATERWALLKFITGGLRIGAGGRLAKQALADWAAKDIAEIEEIWHGLVPPYPDLFAWLEGKAARPLPKAEAPFRPVMLAHPLEEEDLEKLDAAAFAAEWKWDGVRVQAVQEGGAVRLYSRAGEDLSAAFPDVAARYRLPAAIDGELLIRAPDGGVAGFNDLQQRLNRKTADAKLIARFPAFIRAYDLLVVHGEDIRRLTFRDRRERLEALIAAEAPDGVDLSALVQGESWDDFVRARAAPAPLGVEGLMLKRWDAPYVAGRPKGLWFKWKRDPFAADCVLMYAQRGHGKRSSFYSDFTFGAWSETGVLLPVGKAYFGFTDEELKALDKFVRDNTTDRFGPVRAVKPELVLEVAFDGIARSTRHKSGLAMRFPRIARIRWDKPADEADRIETLAALADGG